MFSTVYLSGEPKGKPSLFRGAVDGVDVVGVYPRQRGSVVGRLRDVLHEDCQKTVCVFADIPMCRKQWRVYSRKERYFFRREDQPFGPPLRFTASPIVELGHLLVQRLPWEIAERRFVPRAVSIGFPTFHSFLSPPAAEITAKAKSCQIFMRRFFWYSVIIILYQHGK
jgi:hypothetical protein